MEVQIYPSIHVNKVLIYLVTHPVPFLNGVSWNLKNALPNFVTLSPSIPNQPPCRTPCPDPWGFNVSNLKGIKLRMIDIGKKKLFDFEKCRKAYISKRIKWRMIDIDKKNFLFFAKCLEMYSFFPICI